MNDTFFMQKALEQAKKAVSFQEVPIGAVLVSKDGVILARGYNQVESLKTQLAHAELTVLKKASKKIGSWRLLDTTLYVTLQPCMMCFGALFLSRVSRVVYGVASLKYGMSLKHIDELGIYKNLSMSIECIEDKGSRNVLREFFQKKRSMKRVQESRVRKNKKGPA